MIDLLFPACAVLLGYVVLGITGFGSALVVVPLLAWRWPLPEVVALTLLLDVMASLLLGGLNLRQVDFAELRRLLPGMVAGALAGCQLAPAGAGAVRGGGGRPGAAAAPARRRALGPGRRRRHRRGRNAVRHRRPAGGRLAEPAPARRARAARQHARGHHRQRLLGAAGDGLGGPPVAARAVDALAGAGRRGGRRRTAGPSLGPPCIAGGLAQTHLRPAGGQRADPGRPYPAAGLAASKPLAAQRRR
ncbi:putative exported protein [Bordetella parapertussis Bpp5]|uniref:Probable membrane transporter protein n=1 Tax=Bordetella parapertussis (strain Bpp5) TaxID=1208660 RepID=K0MJQ6_BORPB|nr:putative exported protein [Bordetella parapertussis Bpp5]